MGMFYNFAHYHARTPCSLHGASAYFRHHSSFEIVCGSAFVNGCERTKLCHSAVGLYPSQPISRLAHYSYFPTNLLGIEIGSICQIGACVVGIHSHCLPNGLRIILCCQGTQFTVGPRPNTRVSRHLKLVGVEGFEPPTVCSQSRCTTRLCDTPF